MLYFGLSLRCQQATVATESALALAFGALMEPCARCSSTKCRAIRAPPVLAFDYSPQAGAPDKSLQSGCRRRG